MRFYLDPFRLCSFWRRRFVVGVFFLQFVYCVLFRCLKGWRRLGRTQDYTNSSTLLHAVLKVPSHQCLHFVSIESWVGHFEDFSGRGKIGKSTKIEEHQNRCEHLFFFFSKVDCEYLEQSWRSPRPQKMLREYDWSLVNFYQPEAVCNFCSSLGIRRVN